MSDVAVDLEFLMNSGTIQNEFNRVNSGLKGISQQAAEESRKMRDYYKDAATAIGAYFTFDFAKEFLGSVVEVTGTFQKYQAVLENSFGSTTKAVDALNMLKMFAATTPFQLDEVTGSFVKLVNQGFTPTYAQMVKLGDVASSTGKGIDQLAEAMIDAQTGEFERLKEFGIKASKQGDQVTFSFKGVQTQVDFTNQSIRDYIVSLGDLEGVAGANAKISETLAGQISNLKDKWAAMLNEIGQSNTGAITDGIALSAKAIEHYKDVIDIIKVLVATYGAYKAVLITTTAIQGASTVLANAKAWLQLAATIRTAKDAQVAFNLAGMANPMGLIAGGIALVVSSLYIYSKRQQEAAKELDLHTKTQAEFAEKLKVESTEVERLVSLAKNEKESRETRQKALDKLKESAGGYLDKLTLENIGHQQGADLLRKYNEQLERKYKLEANEKELKVLYTDLALAKKQMAAAEKKLAEVQANTSNYELGNNYANFVKKSLNVNKFSVEFLQKKIDELLLDSMSSTPPSPSSSTVKNKGKSLKDAMQEGVDKWARDWENERQKAIDDLFKKILEKDKESLDKFVKAEGELADKFSSIYEISMTYDQKVDDIKRRYSNEIKVMRAAGMEANVKQLEKMRDEELKSLNDSMVTEYQKTSSLFIKIFANASTMSKKRVEESINIIQSLLSYVNGVDGKIPEGISKEAADKLKQSPESVKEVYEQLFKLQDEFDKRTNYPFSNIVKGLKEIKKSGDFAVEAMKAADDKTRIVITEQAEIAKNKGLNYLKNGAVAAAGAIEQVAQKINELAAAAGDGKLKEVGEQFSAFSSLTSSTAQGFASGGPWGGLASGITNILGQTADAIIQDKAQQIELLQSRTDFLNALRLMDYQVKDTDYENIFGVKSIEKAQDAYKKAQEALDAYTAAVNKKMTEPGKEKEYNNIGAAIYNPIGFGVFGSGKSLTNEFKTLMDAYKKGYTELQGMAIKTKDRSGWSNFWGKKDQFQALKEYAPELWGQDGVFSVEKAKAFLATDKKINEEQRKKIQNVIDLKEAYDANMQVVRDDIADTFGALGSAVTDSLADAIMAGADAWSEFTKAGAASLESLGKKIAFELFFSKKFDNLQKQLEETYGTGKGSEDLAKTQMSILQSFFESTKGDMEAAQKWLEEWQKQAGAAGFDIFSKGNTNTLEGQIRASLTEETGTILAGQISGMRYDVKDIFALSKKQLESLQNIETNTAATVLQLRSVNEVLLAIIDKMKNNSNDLRAIGR